MLHPLKVVGHQMDKISKTCIRNFIHFSWFIYIYWYHLIVYLFCMYTKYIADCNNWMLVTTANLVMRFSYKTYTWEFFFIFTTFIKYIQIVHNPLSITGQLLIEIYIIKCLQQYPTLTLYSSVILWSMYRILFCKQCIYCCFSCMCLYQG